MNIAFTFLYLETTFNFRIDLNKLQITCSIQKQRPNADSNVIPDRVDSIAADEEVECDNTDSVLKTITFR